MIRVLIFLLLGSVCSGVVAQEPVPPKADVVQQMAANPFRRELLKAITAGVANKEITRAQAMTLRTACFAPAFLKRAEEIAKVQMALSGEEVEENAEGKVEVRDWSAFLDFLIKLLPILLDLIDNFTFFDGGSGTYYVILDGGFHYYTEGGYHHAYA
jgi:H+/gluconate symporter-like permease